MATSYFGSGFVELGGMPAYYHYLSEPPVVMLVTAAMLNHENGHSVEKGRFHRENGELRGTAEFKRQDTYIDGTASRSGIPFDVITGGGVVKDNFKDPIHNTYGLLFPDSAPGTEYDVVSTNEFSEGIPHCEILLGRGLPGVSGTDSNYKAAACYTYLTFGYGNTYQFRLALEYNRPANLKFSKDGGSTWLVPVTAGRIATLENLSRQYGELIPLKVYVDRTNEVLRIEIGNGEVLRYGLPRDLTGEMLRGGKLRMQTKNGWASLNIWPARHTTINATVRERDLGRVYSNLANAQFLVNSAGTHPAGQTTTFNLTQNGSKVGVTMEASLEDAGDGLGSEQAPVFTDFTLYTEGVWTQDIDGTPDFRTATGFYKQSVMEEFFDPVNRLFRQRAKVCMSNADGSLNDLVGDLACRIYASNGSGYYPRMTGIGRNPVYERSDPTRLYWMDVQDKLQLFDKEIGQEIQADNWCVYSLVWLVAQLMGVHPQFLWRIPYYRPGRADADCPYPVLGSGVGSSPKHNYPPNVTGIAILLELVQLMNTKEPVSNRVIPWYTGFDIYGDMVFEPIDHFDVLPKWSFSDLDPSGQGQIFGQVHWLPNTDNIRTDIIQQGIDATTGDLLHQSRQVSTQARRLRGTRVPLFDRSPLYVSEAQMSEAGDVMQVLSSIPELTGAFRAPAQENLHAGDVVFVRDFFHGIFDLFVIERVKSLSGCRDVTGMSDQAGFVDCYADYLVRSLVNYF